MLGWPVPWGAPRGRRLDTRPARIPRAGRAIGGFALFAAALAGASFADPDPGYLGSSRCAECHLSESEAWSGSHHALAWTAPSPETVAGEFDGGRFEHDGMVAEFRTEGGDFAVSVTETDGVTTDYRVHSVVGVEPLQQYLLETEAGRLQSFDVVWDTERKAWFHLYPEQELAPDDGLHWTGPYKNWNARCADCHATGYEKTYDPGAKSYASRQAEMGVGCEACHGPGARHLDWAEAGAEEGRGQIPDGYGFSQSFRATAATIQHCARCHARRDAFDDASPLPGTSFHDAYGLALLEPGLYQADGQIQDEVYVYGSFLQSKMYAAGVGCLDCHDAHSAQLLAEGNGLCSQCHSLAGNARFPQLRLAEYDAPGHHFHEPGSPGGQCIACHAPERVYMGNDWRADHSFRVPRPDLARETGATDACTSCHREQSPDWAAAEIAKRYPEAIHRGAHYGQILAAGRANPAAAADDLAGLALAEGEAAIIRASALWLLKQSERPDLAALVAPLLQDRDPLLRAAAVEAQRRAAPYDRLQRLVPLLEDPSRNIRLAVAEALLDVPMTRLSPQLQSQLSSAIWEWRAAMASRLDFPETHLQMGGLALSMRSWPQAEAAFREAVRLDPKREDAWLMLIRIAGASRGSEAAKMMAQRALKAVPQSALIQNWEGLR